MASNDATVSAVAADDSPFFVLCDAHSGREGLLIYNGSTKICFVKFGDECAADDYSFQIAPDSWYESYALTYTGLVTGISDASPSGDIFVTELTG